MTLQGFYTAKGALLREKVGAGLTQLTVTRAAAGGGQTAASAGTLAEEKQALTLGAVKLRDGRAYLPATLAEAQTAQSYTLTELGVYARDPQEGEILYQVFRLSESRVITAGGGSAYRFYLCAIGSTGEIVVECSSGGLLIEEDLDGLWAAVNRKPDAVQYYTTLHVAKTGSDTTGDGSEAKPYLTIQKALGSLPKLLVNRVIIRVHEGNYDENVLIAEFVGREIQVIGDSTESVSINTLRCYDCNISYVQLENLTITGNSGDGYNWSVNLDAVQYASLWNITCTNETPTSHVGAFFIQDVPMVTMNNCTISNKNIALDVVASTVYLNNTVAGANNTVGIRCGSGYGSWGGYVQKGGATIAGEEQKYYGGQIW